MTGLADCNNFFVSCERSVNPSLEGKAVVVLSNNDGCVVARSNESKALGVKMGQPAFELRDMLEKGMVIALSGNHLLYRDISLKVHDVFRRFVPATLDYSVDEAFLDVSGIPTDALPAIGEAIYTACWEEMHIPVTVGFAPSKTLAKIITEISKKQRQRVGLIYGEEDALPLLDSLSITELWGVGRRLAKRLYRSGVFTVGDFFRRDVGWVRAELGVNGERSWRELHCQPCIELRGVEKLMQDSISESRTFPEDVDDYDYLRARIVIYASHCARKLRAMNGVCGSVGVFLRTNPFRNFAGKCRPEGTLHLPHPTDDTILITRASLRILDEILPDGIAFKRAGVWLGDIRENVARTPSIFGEEDRNEKAVRDFMNAVDNINNTSDGGEIGRAHV